jgi:hypothetical protein
VSLVDSADMWRFLALALVMSSSLVACSDKHSEGGLPPAQEWGADPGALSPAPQNGTAGSTDPANPHANINAADMNNPHAGMDMSGMTGGDPSNPHAGLDMSGGDPSNPHAGLGGTDVSKLGLPPPDPNRAIDPAHHIKGVIAIHPKAADRAKPGGALFVVVKRADASGQPTGTPLAVDKLTWQNGEVPFEMTERQAMIAGTQLTGDVVVIARYDQDGDAISKQPGDIVGQLRVTVPADNVKVYLDEVLP